MDDRYDENPSLKYTLVKRMFNNGCHSPIMYYEAAKVKMCIRDRKSTLALTLFFLL